MHNEAYPPFYFVSHKGRAFVYRAHYLTAAEAILAAYDANRLTGYFTCVLSRRPPRLVWVQRKRGYFGLHLVNPSRGLAFGA
jgi:hypothetical protein